MRPHLKNLLTLSAAIAVLAGVALGQGLGSSKAPITGRHFDHLLRAQKVGWQRHLEKLIPEEEGYLVTGPLDPFYDETVKVWAQYQSVRVIVPKLYLIEDAVSLILTDTSRKAQIFDSSVTTCHTDTFPGYRGVLFRSEEAKGSTFIQVQTVNQVRFLIWARQTGQTPDQWSEALRRYARAVSDYLYYIDRDELDSKPPVAAEYGLPAELDLYAEPPDYVIEGYQNYKSFLADHRPIYTDFARGILKFVPSDSLLSVLIKSAPAAAFPNKERPMLQQEYRKFFERGGDLRIMENLTATGFDTLQTGEYFFAVSVTGKIRFGRELLREEVARIEKETGRKVPRANHAFLFPGEPILTAGAFWVDRDSVNSITEVNAQSGHYFYSNVSPTIREDISERSDEYLLTLGHFFRALDSLGIASDHMLIGKM